MVVMLLFFRFCFVRSLDTAGAIVPRMCLLSCRVMKIVGAKERNETKQNKTKQNDTIADSYLFCSFEVSIRGIDMPFCKLKNCLSDGYGTVERTIRNQLLFLP